jgi:hypothetical protein
MTDIDQHWRERMEAKIDRLAEAVVTLARMEERMITLFRRMDHYDSQMQHLMERFDKIEQVTTTRGVFFRVADKAGWLIVGALIAYMIRYNGG